MPPAGTAVEIAPWLRHLSEHIDLVRAGDQPESVHQVRVAAGRLDVWMRSAHRSMLRDDLRWLRRAAAQLRDFDVLLERALPIAFVQWLTVERAEARDRMLAALNSARCPSLLGALALLEPLDEREISKQVEVERRKVKRRGRALERAAATTEQAHRLRRAVRRMRYAREWLGEKPRELKSLQDELGRLNDAASALAHLDQCPHAAQLTQLRGEIAAELQRAFDDAREAWRETDVETA